MNVLCVTIMSCKRSANISRTIPPSGLWIEKIQRRAYINTPLRMVLRKFSAAFAHKAWYPQRGIAEGRIVMPSNRRNHVPET